MERDHKYMESLFCGKMEGMFVERWKGMFLERWKGMVVLALSVRAYHKCGKHVFAYS
jgi:hypothetical protein